MYKSRSKSSLSPGTIARGIVDFHQKNTHFFLSFLLKILLDLNYYC